MNEFDLINSPLEGVNLIEASAGTGKTHTISFLLLRLILEKKLTIDRILVVTFTQAATQELKDRVFSFLLNTRDAIISRKSDEPLIHDLIQKREDTQRDLETIQNAISDFDKASIFTIHGFCSRILHDNAFETANRFDEELIQDPFVYLQEVTDDFWRKNIYQSPVEFTSYIHSKLKGKGPDYFLNLLSKVNALEVDIIPTINHCEIQSLIPFRDQLNKIKDKWISSKDNILSILADESLKGNIYGSLKSEPEKLSKRDLKIQSLANDMDLYLGCPGFPLFKNFHLLTLSKITDSVKKGKNPPAHAFFEVCDDLYKIAQNLEAEFETYLLFLKGQLFKHADTELDKMKILKSIRFFNDLILKVRNAIRHSENSNGVFINEIQSKYKAALVDEFQDTDSVQYEIFSTLFSAKQNLLFMIGDPKQAIYSFRGADLFSYMQAARKTDLSYTLTENWRSSQELIKAVNTFFSNVNNPFIFKDISFDRGSSAFKEHSEYQLETAPVKIWFVSSKSGKPLNKADAEKITARAAAGEIAALVSSGKNQCKKQFSEGDIAVLVRTNRQAMVIKHYLSERKINSVLFSTGDLFETSEAEEMERLLIAIYDPGNDRKMRAAFCTDIVGVCADTFEQVEAGLMEDIYKRFKEYKHVWIEKGFMHMFNRFLYTEAVLQRLLSYPDGERRVTNILHLAEIIQNETEKNQRGITSLIRWLSEQRNPDIPRKEEHQLHLESDRRAVNIVTVHKSKGLEYPVVFCPFSWEGMMKQDEDVRFHKNDAEKKLTFDLRGKKAGPHVALAQKEQLAENMRLFYVAMTRAKQACYLAWGDIKSVDTSAISYLLYGDTINDDTDIFMPLKNHAASKSSEEKLTDLQELSSLSEGSIEILPLKESTSVKEVARKEGGHSHLFSRKFKGDIDTSWKILSYSSLISAREKEIDTPDHDLFMRLYTHLQTQLPDEIREKDESIFSFPKGAKAGLFFHDLLEHLDFASSEPEAEKRLILEKLHIYGFDLKWKDMVYHAIHNILNTPLISESNPFTLSQISNANRINEMEFYYPTTRISPEKFTTLFTGFQGADVLKQFPAQLEKLTFSPAQGFMKGYIDLVFFAEDKFYLIDWKSNFLGYDIENYHTDNLIDVMHQSFYTLQYHIYTLALHQYLASRYPEYNYETHFGGIFYIFLRGVDKNLGHLYGIFKDRTDPDLLNEMGEMLIPGFTMV